MFPSRRFRAQGKTGKNIHKVQLPEGPSGRRKSSLRKGWISLSSVSVLPLIFLPPLPRSTLLRMFRQCNVALGFRFQLVCEVKETQLPEWGGRLEKDSARFFPQRVNSVSVLSPNFFLPLPCYTQAALGFQLVCAFSGYALDTSSSWCVSSRDTWTFFFFFAAVSEMIKSQPMLGFLSNDRRLMSRRASVCSFFSVFCWFVWFVDVWVASGDCGTTRQSWKRSCRASVHSSSILRLFVWPSVSWTHLRICSQNHLQVLGPVHTGRESRFARCVNTTIDSNIVCNRFLVKCSMSCVNKTNTIYNSMGLFTQDAKGELSAVWTLPLTAISFAFACCEVFCVMCKENQNHLQFHGTVHTGRESRFACCVNTTTIDSNIVCNHFVVKCSVSCVNETKTIHNSLDPFTQDVKAELSAEWTLPLTCAAMFAIFALYTSCVSGAQTHCTRARLHTTSLLVQSS